jgi:hypothetical protein
MGTLNPVDPVNPVKKRGFLEFGILYLGPGLFRFTDYRLPGLERPQNIDIRANNA